MRTLLVDDDESARRLMAEILRSQGHHVVELPNAEAAWELYIQERFPLLLLDWLMPGMTGLELCRKIRALPRGDESIILVVTACDEPGDLKQVLQAGADDYLAKPIDINQFKVRIAVAERQVRMSARRKRTEEALRISEERYALAARGANDGLWDWDLRTDEVYYSERWKTMLGYQEREIGADPREWLDRIHPDDRAKAFEAIADHLDGKTPHFENEHRMRSVDGTYRWMLIRGLAVRDESNVASRFAGSQTDITARKLSEERLQHDAFHDALTGLANRTLFMERLGRAMRRRERRPDHQFAVLFLDLDRFKTINDSLGHMVGDQFLICVAHLLQGSLRPNDTIARFGGDEFAILLDDIDDLGDATRIAERIHLELANPIAIDGQEVFSSASIGIAMSTPGYLRPEQLLRDADTAMYRAKAKGRSGYEVFDKDMHDRVVALLRLETELRQAVERQDFQIHYQPIVSLTTGLIVGFEALVRWRHPERGFLAPAEFLSTAEEMGLMLPIGAWVLQEACRQLRVWQDRFPAYQDLAMSVNLSGKQFLQPSLVEDVARILQETGLAPRNLQLEITESMMMDNAKMSDLVFSRLRDLNVPLHVDDFGTGFSSLSTLHHFPIDTLKIDRSFVCGLDASDERGEIVETIMTLANNLGLSVIAEGIETDGHLRRLRELGCPHGQGNLFSEPVDSERAEALLAAQPRW